MMQALERRRKIKQSNKEVSEYSRIQLNVSGLGHALSLVHLLDAFSEVSPDLIEVDLLEAWWALVVGLVSSIARHVAVCSWSVY